jgi:hypothetical protein
MQQRAWMLVVAVVGIGFVAACDDDEPTAPSNITYTATLRGTTEVPTNTSAGTGLWTGVYNPTTKIVTYTMTFQGLSGTASASHIHGPATPTTSVGVIFNFASPPTGHTGTLTLSGASGSANGTINIANAITATISGDSLIKMFDAGAAYVNVHSTPNFGGGEIRGTITRQ